MSQPTSASAWKQEVNRRVAAHKSRRGESTAKPKAPVAAPRGTSSRAAQAAARVAARYAQAPSYSQMQAAEARAALRAAEIATQVALEVQAAAKAALARLQAATAGPLLWEPEASGAVAPERPSAQDWEPTVEHAQPAASFSLQASENVFPHIRWEPDFPVRQPEPAAARAPRHAEGFAAVAEDGWDWPASAEEPWGGESIESVEPVLPIHANLIEFPRELVATRKVRPRLVEGPFAAEGAERQLSIFEVDPGAVSTQPEAADAAPATAEFPWPSPEWSGIELEAQPLPEPAPQQAPAAPPALQLAPIGHRLMATVVDGALITGAFLAAAVVAVANIQQLPAARIVETGAASALLLVALLYQTLFFTLAEATPGMKYARLSLCTFDDQSPTRAQRRWRLGALLLSVLPVGLGVAWVLFDDDHLSWHDRLSRTYLRKC